MQAPACAKSYNRANTESKIMKTAHAPDGTQIHFSADDHRYWTPLTNSQTNEVHEVEYESVTSLLKRFYQPFDAQTIADRIAARDGTTPDALKAKWKEAGRVACHQGTRVHEICEDALTGKPPRHQPETDKERALMAAGWTFAIDAMKRGMVVAVEQIVFSMRYRVAGTMDWAMFDASGKLWLLDWKTNKEIRTTGFNGATMIEPLMHLPDCELYRYALQLLTYEWLLRAGKWITRDAPVGRGVIHLTETGARFVPTPDLRDEVLSLMLNRESEVPF